MKGSGIEITKELTIPKLFVQQCRRYGRGRVAMREKEFGIWIPYTWQDYYDLYDSRGVIPVPDEIPVGWETMIYNDRDKRIGYATSFMYSPVLQRHIALARLRPDMAKPGTRVNLEFTINHHYVQVGAHVTRTPFFTPDRKTSMHDRMPGAQP